MDLPISPVIKVIPNELTCTGCGETFPATWKCPRCNDGDEESVPANGRGRRIKRPAVVPTISYLRPEEYVVMQ